MEECRSSPSLRILNKGVLTSQFNILYWTLCVYFQDYLRSEDEEKWIVSFPGRGREVMYSMCSMNTIEIFYLHLEVQGVRSVHVE